MRFRTFLTCLSLLPLSACTKSCNDYDNNEEFSHAKLPAYTETGAGTLGCVLGPQTWTVLGSYYQNRIGYPWEPNSLSAGKGIYSIPPHLGISGRMTGVRDSKTFYDMQLGFTIPFTDTLTGLHLLGSDTLHPLALNAGSMFAQNMLTYGDDFVSYSQHPLRLLVRKHDQQQRTVSGTFEGMLYQRRGHDSLAVSDGRFDVKY
jgi:hypothetical protein